MLWQIRLDQFTHPSEMKSWISEKKFLWQIWLDKFMSLPQKWTIGFSEKIFYDRFDLTYLQPPPPPGMKSWTLYFSFFFIHTIKKSFWSFCIFVAVDSLRLFHDAKSSYLKGKHKFYTDSQGWKHVADISHKDRISIGYIIPVGIWNCYNIIQ